MLDKVFYYYLQILDSVEVVSPNVAGSVLYIMKCLTFFFGNTITKGNATPLALLTIQVVSLLPLVNLPIFLDLLARRLLQFLDHCRRDSCKLYIHITSAVTKLIFNNSILIKLYMFV